MTHLLLVAWLVGPAVHAAPEAPASPVAAQLEAATGYPLYPALQKLLEDPVFVESQVALQIVNVRTGEEVFGWNPDLALLPASTTKVITAAAALRNLGPAWRFSTELLRVGEINPEGVLEGDLYIRGNGDPTMVIEKAWKMVQDLQVAGIVEVNGDLIFDDSWFAGSHLIPGWDKPVDVANGPSYYAPIGALNMNFNTVDLVVGPGPRVGEPARVQSGTASKLITIDNQIETVEAGRRPWIRLEREVGKDGASISFKLEGRIASNEPVERYYRAVGKPTAWSMSVWESLLKKEGVKINGKTRVDEAPDNAVVVVELNSQPLSEVLNHTLKYSSNQMAELVLRAVGAQVFGDPASDEKGLKVLQGYLSSLGIPADEYVLRNGSGLTREGLLRPSHLNAVLVDLYHDPLLSPEFQTALSVSGVDGTLRRRFDDDGEVARVRGKTGSLNGVYCLTSYVHASDGETYAFTFLVNDFKRSRPVRALQDAVGSTLLSLEGLTVAGAPSEGGRSAQ